MHQLAERDRVDLYAFKIETEPPLGNFRLVPPHVPRKGTIENHLFRKRLIREGLDPRRESYPLRANWSKVHRLESNCREKEPDQVKARLPKRMLIVDHERSATGALDLIFSEAGFAVLTAESLAESIE